MSLQAERSQGQGREGSGANVRVMDSSPPPAPASAWAILSPWFWGARALSTDGFDTDEEDISLSI